MKCSRCDNEAVWRHKRYKTVKNDAYLCDQCLKPDGKEIDNYNFIGKLERHESIKI